MPSRARERQLAKLAARRQAERDQRKRRRNLILGVVAAVVALALVALGAGILLSNGDDGTAASGAPSASATPAKPPGTQTGTVNPVPAPTTVACGAKAPPDAGKPKPQFSGPPPMTIDQKKTYTATMVTSCGTMVIELDPKTAPETVNSFVFLAKKHFFDGQYFFRLDTSIDVIQGGSPTDSGTAGPGYTIPDELTGNESYVAGTLAMANSGANTGGSQFFLISGPNGTNLDTNPAYTIFGHITEGMDVARKIQQLPVVNEQKAKQGDFASQAPKDAIYMDSVTVRAS